MGNSSMDENTRQTLERLHRQLDMVQFQDEAQQARLNHIRQSLRGTLDQPEADDATSFNDLLTEAVILLGEGNPDVTRAIKEAIDSLSRAGI